MVPLLTSKRQLAPAKPGVGHAFDPESRELLEIFPMRSNHEYSFLIKTHQRGGNHGRDVGLRDFQLAPQDVRRDLAQQANHRGVECVG